MIREDSIENQIVRDMAAVIVEWLDERYPKCIDGRRDVPDNILLQVHPSVAYAIRKNEILGFTDPVVPEIPIKITTDVPRDSWRLVTITEEVHIGGSI